MTKTSLKTHKDECAEDFDLWSRLAERGTRFEFVKEPLGQYTLHAANNSGSIERHMAASTRVFNRHVATLEPKRIFDSFRARRARARIVYGAERSCQRLGQPRLALRCLIKSISEFPVQPKAFAAIAMVLLASQKPVP